MPQVHGLTLFHVWGGGRACSFFFNNFLFKNRCDLKILDLLSYTYLYGSIELKDFNMFDYSSVDNHPKFTEIKKMFFWAIKATVNKFLHFFVTI